MTAGRIYKRPMSTATARAELAREAGAQFDPVIVRAFLNISLGRLRVAIGPLAWVAGTPLMGWLPALRSATAAAGDNVVSLAGTAAGAAVITAGSAFVPAIPANP